MEKGNIKDYNYYLEELEDYLGFLLVYSRLGLGLFNMAEDMLLYMLREYIQEIKDPKVREEMMIVYRENIDQFKERIRDEYEVMKMLRELR